MSSPPVSEVKVVSSLALLYVFRMLGLFMVLPVLMLYGENYSGSSAVLLGLALGIYGFTQACLQVPLGLLSDVWGRKPVIALGLVVFALGSVVAANADSVWGLIVGRALQGAGAIASAIMALVADVTAEENRTKAMAAIGASIGVSFSLALVLGPAVAAAGGLSAVFWLSAALAGVGLLVVWRLVPGAAAGAAAAGRDTRTIPHLIADTLRHGELLRLDFGIFCLHFILMASFVAVPGMLEALGIAAGRHWQVYLPVMVLSFIAMLPLIFFAERRQQVKGVFLAAVLVLILAQLGLARWHGQFSLGLFLLFAFFMAFNLLEATLPSLTSKWAPAAGKGTAMGIYSTTQFLGAFAGGLAGGVAAENWGAMGVFAVCGVIATLWWLAALFMRPPRRLTSVKLRVAEGPAAVAAALAAPGVADAAWVDDEEVLYLKVDERRFDRRALLELTGAAECD